MFRNKKNFFTTANSNDVFVIVDQFSKIIRIYAKEISAITYCKQMNKITGFTGKEYIYYRTDRQLLKKSLQENA